MAHLGEQTQAHGGGDHVAAQIGRHARTRPDEVAVVYLGSTPPRQVTYRELDDRAARLARILHDRGVGNGDRVAILMMNRPEYLEAVAAIMRLGAIAVPLNARLTPAEANYQLATSGSTALLVDDDLAELAAAAVAEQTAVRFRLKVGAGWEAAIAKVDPIAERWLPSESPAVIMYTSGTTGRPKGAVLSHANLYAYVTARYAHLGFPAACRTALCAVPLFHIAGFMTCLAAIYVGGRVVLTRSGAFDPQETIDVLLRERVNQAFFVPAQWQAIVRHPSIVGRAFPDLLAANWGAAPATAELVREIQAAFPTTSLTSAFGMTETTSTALVLMPGDALARPDSIGKPLLGVEVRVVDATMNDVPVGEVGELVYRGPSVMVGYWDEPEQTAEAFRGGWFHSGDLVRVDEDGFFYVVDRLKDMIISGGENIYCAEVENVLAGHPKVGAVAVVGCRDERWGEVPVAVVVARDGEPPSDSELESWARSRLAPYKVPRRVVVIDEMPMNANGKIRKPDLRALVRDGE